MDGSAQYSVGRRGDKLKRRRERVQVVRYGNPRSKSFPVGAKARKVRQGKARPR